MLIYEGETGTVTKGIFTGFKFLLKVNGRVVPATPWMKRRMGELHYGLREAGLDSLNDPAVKAL